MTPDQLLLLSLGALLGAELVLLADVAAEVARDKRDQRRREAAQKPALVVVEASGQSTP